jgi:hypothetical protein
MPTHRGLYAGGVALPPTVVPQAATNFNQDRSTFSAYVTANLHDTTVYFDYSTSSTFASFSTVTHWVTVTGGPYYAYYNVSGLSPATTYYYRCRAVNAAGTTIGATSSFTTWSLKTYTNTSAGSWSFSIPSITPYLDAAVAPTIYEMLLYGGGGGANYAGGGGGGYRLFASHTSSIGGTQTISGSIGAGGAGGNGGVGVGGATAGGSTTLTIGSSSWSAGGGAAGQHPGNCAAPNGTGGAVGAGSNPAYVGGNNTYGYYYFTGNYVQVVVGYNSYCCQIDKNGVCLQYCPDYNSPIYGNDPNQPIYAWNCGYYAGGGGAGTDSNGASAATQASASHVGGAGGAGGGAYGLRGGNGGGGRGTQGVGANGSVPAGSGAIVGTGGQGWYNAGTAGGITFKYYGP